MKSGVAPGTESSAQIVLPRSVPSQLLLTVLASIGLLLVHIAPAAESRIQLQTDGFNVVLSVQGHPDNDWRLQTSHDLLTWSNLTAFGTIRAAHSNAPARVLTPPDAPQYYLRAVKTAGLYDPTLFRTIFLTFTQANWSTLMANGRNNGSNVLGTLRMDNGSTNMGIGARYKGNSSYTLGGAKKSINLEFDYTNSTFNLMGYETVNLNNAAGDETIMREPLYFNTMELYAPCPQGSMARVYINENYWGVYALIQQENGQLINEWFSSNTGDRWRAPNIAGGGGGFSGAGSALSYLGTNIASYRSNYELKTDNSTNAWQRLVHACDVLNNTPELEFRDRIEEVLAVDRWLWFLALENIFADDDSYFNKGADYGFYYEPESGRIHPIEHDGNEAFTPGDATLSPLQGSAGTNRPVLLRLLGVPEFRQRYLAHMRTVLEERYNPAALNPLIDRYHALSINDIITDPSKNFSMPAYTNDLNALKNFIVTRHTFLTNHAELRPLPPLIPSVSASGPRPDPTQQRLIIATVLPQGTNGLDSVWLYHRGHSYGQFAAVPMWDDGAHTDGLANDGLFGALVTNYPAGTRVRYYVEARSANSARAASFAPARAEQETFSYRVVLATATNTSVIINEIMASNTSTLTDPQGEYDDWIELHNITDQDVDLTGRYLSDEPNNPRKWAFPTGTIIPAEGYLLVWADEDSSGLSSGLHTSFRLSADGEQLFLIDSDAKFNAVLDSVTFGPQTSDRSYGRSGANADLWVIVDPTPSSPNQ